jgi:hypothetical protein
VTSPDDAGVNEALLAAIPQSQRVLELGCADGSLGARYKETHGPCTWCGVDVNEASLSSARQKLDRVYKLDLETDSLEALGTGYDAIVLGDVLEHLREPERLLRSLHDVAGEDALLFMCMPNMSHASVIERLIWGDAMYDPTGLMDRTHLRLFAPRSVFKMLLDCGWLPSAAGGYKIPHGNAAFERLLLQAGGALGLPAAAVDLNVTTYQLVIRCKRYVRKTPGAEINVGLTAVAGITNEPQFSLNLARSPGLREIGAKRAFVSDAASVAGAIGAAKAHGAEGWLLLCQQDVYVPALTGRAIAEVLRDVPPSQTRHTVIGFAGIGLGDDSQPAKAGLMVDRFTLLDFPESERALSLSDAAVLIHSDCAFAVDSDLGFDFWATDLAMQASALGTPARIVRVPIYHNSVQDDRSGARAAHAQRLLAKYPGLASSAVYRL